jgi:hypothetical protein
MFIARHLCSFTPVNVITAIARGMHTDYLTFSVHLTYYLFHRNIFGDYFLNAVHTPFKE